MFLGIILVLHISMYFPFRCKFYDCFVRESIVLSAVFVACDVTVHFNSLFSVMKQLSMITVEVFVFPKKIIF